MSVPRKSRDRDPVATRDAILAAARTILAKDGAEGLSMAQVASLAGVNRGTAYQHFSDRKQLLNAAIASVSRALIDQVWSQNDPAPIRFNKNTVGTAANGLAEFTVQNETFCRIWLFELLSSDDPGSDPFSMAWFQSVRAFCASDDAIPGIDAEAYAAFTLMAYLSWPVWRHAEKLEQSAQRETAQRLVAEVLRMAMYGIMKPDRFPTVQDTLARKSSGLLDKMPLR